MREKAITRTIDTTIIRYTVANATTAMFESETVVLQGKHTSESAMTHARKHFNTATRAFMSAEVVSEESAIYGMTELDFITHASPMDNRFTKIAKGSKNITRTIVVSVVHLIIADVETMTFETAETALTGKHTPETAMEYARKHYDTETRKCMKAVIIQEDETVYGMTEHDFMLYASKMESRFESLK